MKEDDKVQVLLKLCPASLRLKLLETKDWLDSTYVELKGEIMFQVTNLQDNAGGKKLPSVAALAVGLALFLPLGASGVAWAVALGAATAYVIMGLLAWRTLRGLESGEVRTIDEADASTAG